MSISTPCIWWPTSSHGTIVYTIGAVSVLNALFSNNTLISLVDCTNTRLYYSLSGEVCELYRRAGIFREYNIFAD